MNPRLRFLNPALIGAVGVVLLRSSPHGDAAFSRLLLSTWIGAVPTTPGLKMALLGTGKP